MTSDRHDTPSRPAHKVLYDLKIAKAIGAEFQALFERIMEKHDRSFSRIKPGGPEGDWKSDGFSGADGKIYQCYAPETIRTKPTIDKIAEDYAGARGYWGERLKHWVFVVNKDGLPAEIVATLSDLKKAQAPAIGIDWYTPERLWTEIVAYLSEANLDELFGRPPPTDNSISDLVKQAGKALRSDELTKCRTLCNDLLDRTIGLHEHRKDRADTYQLLAHLDLGDGKPKEARRHLDLGDAEYEDGAPTHFHANSHRLRAASWQNENHFELVEEHFRQALDVRSLDLETADERRLLEETQCFTRVDYILHRTRLKQIDGLHEHVESIETYARQNPAAQEGTLPLRVADALISYHARRGEEDSALRAVEMIRQCCSTKDLAFAGATLLLRLTGRMGHFKATSVAIACARLSAELADRAERTDFYWAAQANLASVYLSNGQLEQARRQLEVLDPVLRNDQIDPQLKAGILSLAAAVLAESGAREQAAGLIEKAQQHMRAEPALVAQTEFDRGRYLRDAGRTDEALIALLKADHLARDTNAPGEFIYHINVLTVEAAIELGRWDEAEVGLTALQTLPRGDEFVDDVLDVLRHKLHGTREIKRRVEDIRALPLKDEAGSLRQANALAFKPLLTWWRDSLANAQPSRHKRGAGYTDKDFQILGILYDYWGGGSAAKVMINLRRHAPNHFTPFVEVRSMQDVRRAIRMLTLVSDCLILLWKGTIETEWTSTVAPLNYECGGAGYMGFLGTLLRGPKAIGPWVAITGCGAYLPLELIKFLTTDALPLIEQGRLFVLPAPAVGCSEDAFGPAENLLVDLMSATSLAQTALSVSSFPLGILPYFDDAPIGSLADLVAQDTEAPRRLRLALIRKTNELRVHGVIEAVNREIADEIADALAALDGTHRGLSRKRGFATRRDPLGATAISFQNAWAPVLTLRRLGYRMTLADPRPGKGVVPARFAIEEGTPFGNWLHLPGQNMGIPVIQASDKA